MKSSVIPPERLPYHELIGLPVRVGNSCDPTLKGLSGIIIDESRNTFRIETESGLMKTVPKSGTEFIFTIPERISEKGRISVKIQGNIMLSQPQNRIKNLKKSRLRGHKMARDIGLDIPEPHETCDDINCPFHGKLAVRGQVLVGKVVSSKMDKSVVIERYSERIVSKFQRYEKRHSTMHAHNPPCINAQPGDIVTIAECRPLSKTKSFVVVKAEKAE